MTRRISKAVLAAWALVAATGCRGTVELAPDDSDRVLVHQLLDAPDPSRRGPFAVQRLFYGSGTDKNRPEYRDSVAFTTEPSGARFPRGKHTVLVSPRPRATSGSITT